jgi:hypothetical protein
MVNFSSNDPLGYMGINTAQQPPLLSYNRAPTVNDKLDPGVRWIDISAHPHVIYQTVGGGVWNLFSGTVQATTTIAGITRYATTNEVLTGTGTNNAALAADVFAAVSAIVIGQVATQAQTNAGTNDARIVTPLKLTKFLNNAPPAIGLTNPSSGSFTTLKVSGLATFTGKIALNSSAGPQILSGNGDPTGVITAPKGSLWLRIDGSSSSTRAYINTNAGTGWSAITTVS